MKQHISSLADENITQHLNHWSFSWPVMDVMIGGQSSIDLSHLEIHTDQDAKKFLKNYGYDPDDETDRKLIHCIFIESINFIAKILMPKEWRQGIRPPGEVFEAIDGYKLLVWASQRDPANAKRQAWSCAILRLMHTIAHIDGAHRAASIDVAREQITARFQNYLFRNSKGDICFGEKIDHIALERVEWKYAKTRESIILKLLHKPGNVAETIYDLLGVRLITRNLSEALLAVRYLEKFNLIIFPNNIPARARNTLIDVDGFKQHLEDLNLKLKSGQITSEEFANHLDALPIKSEAKSTNPHSNDGYRSIQLTCRQRIHFSPFKNRPLLKAIRDLGDQPTSHPQIVSELTSLEQFEQESERRNELSTFFPYEVQIIDKASAEATAQSEASHSKYKKAQIRTARRRILVEVLGMSAHFENLSTPHS